MSYWRIQDQLHARRILIPPPSSDTCQTIAANTVRAIRAALATCAVPAVVAVRATHTVSAIPTVRTISAMRTTRAIDTTRALCAFLTPTAVCAVCAMPAVHATPASKHVVAINALLTIDHQSRADNNSRVILRGSQASHKSLRPSDCFLKSPSPVMKRTLRPQSSWKIN
jgi:hypothetical protein